MSQAPTYTRLTGFADDERDNAGGRSTVVTADVDNELDRIAQSLNPTISNLALLQRDDGVMRDGAVPVTALGADTLKLLTATGAVRGSWLTATSYAVKDLVTQGGNTYICVAAHTSGTFSADLTAVKWILFQIGANPAAAAIPFTPTVNILSSNIQAALAEVDTNSRTRDTSATSDLSDTATASKGAGRIGFTPALGYASGTVGKYLTDIAASGSSSTGAALVGFSQANAYGGGTVGSRLSQDISVLDLKYMTLAQIVDVVSYTGAVDVTACIQAALNDMANTVWLGASGPTAYAKGGGKVYLPPGKWKITSTLLVGNNTELFGASAFGSTAGAITSNTGTVLSCSFSTQKQWAISSATYEAPAGTFAVFNRQFSGAEHDGGLMTLCFGIKVHNLTINGNGAYGGVRLMGGAGFDVQNIFAYNVGVGYLFNTCYGARYGNLRSQHSLYGMVISNCTAMECGHFYADKTATTWSNVAADTTTRLVGTFDMSTGAFLPADWTNKSFGLYVSGCIDMTMTAQTCEHSDVGSAFAHVSNLLLTGYFEGNGDSDCTFVASTGQVTVFANATTSGFKYHFGTLNNVTLESCSIGGIYVGETTSNKIRVQGSDSAGGSTTDWTWSDVIDFRDVGNVLRVAAAGTTSAVLGYTTLDEAIRRINASRADRQSWIVNIKDGDTVVTAAQSVINQRSIVLQREGSGTKPTISVGAAGGGFIFRWSMDGNVSLRLLNVNVSFPTGTAGAAGDQALLNSSGALNLDLSMTNVIVNQGAAYSLLGTFANTSMSLRAAFGTCGITSTSPAPLLRSSGSALTTSIQANTTMDANIKALGTNGLQGTVVSSNFV